MILFDNLWNVMKEKGISQYTLIKKYGISPGQITRLKLMPPVVIPDDQLREGLQILKKSLAEIL